LVAVQGIVALPQYGGTFSVCAVTVRTPRTISSAAFPVTWVKYCELSIVNENALEPGESVRFEDDVLPPQDAPAGVPGGGAVRQGIESVVMTLLVI
jgi:hypothetical protein